ncbi:MAG TPA: hypothetical protein VL625_11825 [Patescibacteria group bacterium]|nr:hypothetical protein [Patescibacteria group bacterium]
MEIEGNDVIITRRVYDAAVELVQAAAHEHQDPAFMVERIVLECRAAGDESALRFWNEVREFIDFLAAEALEMHLLKTQPVAFPIH